MVIDQTNERFGQSNGAKGTLHTRVVNSGSIAYIDAKGKSAELTLDDEKNKWIGTQKFSWLSPELKYFGKFNYTRMKEILKAAGTTFAGPEVSYCLHRIGRNIDIPL